MNQTKYTSLCVIQLKQDVTMGIENFEYHFYKVSYSTIAIQ